MTESIIKSPQHLIDTINLLKNYCESHEDCNDGCLLYGNSYCSLNGDPCEYDDYTILENIKINKRKR